MRKDLLRSASAVLVFAALLGLAYPLVVTGISQVVLPGRADGSLIHRNGKVVGSSLQAQAFTKPVLDKSGKPQKDAEGNVVTEPDPEWFQPRPSQSGYSGSATFFSNRGPNQASAQYFYRDQLAAYLALEKPYDRGLTAGQVPVDAVTTSASGVDPHISVANARIQAHRIAAARRLPLAQVVALVDAHTEGRALGLLGEPGVNVLELNLALDHTA
jgi:potassium-transporting ATPase KdpC subunit